MRHLASKNRIDAWLDSGHYREAAEALLTLIAAEPECLPAYRKLGVAYLRLMDYAAAERYFLRAAEGMPGDPGGFDGLAETYGHLGDAARARSFGRRALVLKDAAVPFVVHPGRSPAPRPGGVRLIAFSLFGAEPRYCETAVSNAEVAPGVLPGWTCRFHVDATVPRGVLDRLHALNAQVVTVEGPRHDLPKTMWRFLALADVAADAVICRDADSLLNPRDAGWVGAWMESGRPFHIIRDYFSHTELMLAGLFGVRGGVLDGIEETMRRWVSSNDAATRWTDQHFLRGTIWPLTRDTALTHDPWFGYGSNVAAGTSIVADATEHVGANQSTITMRIKVDQADGCVVRWTLVDAARRNVCGYAGAVRDGHVLVVIPRSYSAGIQSGALHVLWTTTAGIDGCAGEIRRLSEPAPSREPHAIAGKLGDAEQGDAGIVG